MLRVLSSKSKTALFPVFGSLLHFLACFNFCDVLFSLFSDYMDIRSRKEYERFYTYGCLAQYVVFTAYPFEYKDDIQTYWPFGDHIFIMNPPFRSGMLPLYPAARHFNPVR